MKRTIVVLLLLGLVFRLYSQTGSPDPSIRYAELLGYKWSYNPKTGSDDVTLPNGTKVDSWAFYRGLVGAEYSYCEKKGYKLKSSIFKSGKN